MGMKDSEKVIKGCKNCKFYDYKDEWCVTIGESKQKNDECNVVDDEGNLLYEEGKMDDWVDNY